MGGYQLEMYGISKAFQGVQALDGVDFKVGKGEVHALLGENGAGKSTLMRIAMGIYRADAGKMIYDGKPVVISSPAQALSIGISMIHQELNPQPHLTVAENIFLHREPTFRRTSFINKKKTNKMAQEILDKFNFKVPPTALMGSLTVAQMQMIEIIKAVSCDAKLIIMDEPTSSLDSGETKRLFDTIRDLKKRGISIVYISHRMEEIFEICDSVSVFRDGRYIGTRAIGEVDKDTLISMMVGRSLTMLFPKTEVPIGDVVFEVKGLSGKGFDNVSFQVRSGEILGFAGLVGAGRSEIMCSVFGLQKKTAGKIYYKNRELVINSPRAAINKGIAMVTEDRKNYGLVLMRSIKENISLPNLPKNSGSPFLNKKKEKAEVLDMQRKLSIKAAGLEAEAMSLSGGNQQKVVIAKWLMANPRVLILDEPTRGIDVGAKAEIHKLMCRLAGEGMAIILISSELPELIGMCDRVLVVCEGKLNGEFTRAEILSQRVTQKEILAKALGE